MKILIVPWILHPKSDATYYLTQNLASLLTQQGHVVAISADVANQFHNASIYPCPSPAKHFLRFRYTNRSYEEWMDCYGAIDEDYLQEDLKFLLGTIEHFHPDFILTMDRLAAISAGRLTKIPVDAVVHSALFINMKFPTKTLREYNRFLSSLHLEQVLTLKEIYKQCRHLFGFGPLEVQPYPAVSHVSRIPLPSITPIRKGLTNRVTIYLPSVHKSPLALKKILTEAFLGAPYAVYIWYPGSTASKNQNIHFMKHPREDMISGSICMIHDGNDYYMNQCIVQGIPQVVIASHEYSRAYNARAIQRNDLGRFIFEEDFNMAYLYETFRKVLTDDRYYEGTQNMMKKIAFVGDLSKILDYWK